jgi:putative toxin-antitoxin system antitoxin component (TIGR02293 family)
MHHPPLQDQTAAQHVARDSGVGEYGALAPIVAILGGERVTGRDLRTKLDVHELILSGFPHGVIAHLVASIPALKNETLLKQAVGMSLRTSQRKLAGNDVLTPGQSSKTWNFAEVMARGAAVFGSQEAALAWLTAPALGLDGRAPIDLMASGAGAELVKDLLTRLEYGVYA